MFEQLGSDRAKICANRATLTARCLLLKVVYRGQLRRLLLLLVLLEQHLAHGHYFGLGAEVLANVVRFARATVLMICVLALVEGRVRLRGIYGRVRARDALSLL